MVSEFSEYPNYVLGCFIYFFIYAITITYIRIFLVNNVFALIMVFLLSIVLLVGLGLMFYKYFIKTTIDSVNKETLEKKV